MERKKLLEAAMKGDVEQLQNLIKENPFLLLTAALADGDTPLHVACVASNLGFVQELLSLAPGLTNEVSRDGLTPLHVAAAKGDVGVVKELIKSGGARLCLVKGREGRIPLHAAVAKGRGGVVEELAAACPDSVVVVTARGESCLHLGVKLGQFEGFGVICDCVVKFGREEVLNWKDGGGNTVLHLAASRKQYESKRYLTASEQVQVDEIKPISILELTIGQIFNLLLGKNSSFKDKLDVKSLNNKRQTPLDILIEEGGDLDIEEILLNSEAPSPPSPPASGQAPSPSPANRPRSASQRLQDYFKYDKINESPSKARNTLLVIAILIVTATYQAVLSPPGGVWEADFRPAGGGGGGHTAGQAVMGTNRYVSYGLFLLFNSMGFFMSLHLINFLTLGLPLQFEIRVALFALTATYDTCMVAIAPPGILSTFFIVLSVMMPAIMVLLTKVVRDFGKGRCRRVSRAPEIP